MTQMLNITKPLTDDEQQKVVAFAEALIASRAGRSAFVDVDAIRGIFAGMGGDKSDKELIREAWDDVVAKYDKR